MRQARGSLRQTVTPVDEVNDLQMDMQEVMGDLNDVDEAISRRYETPFDVDEDDLEAEFLML